MQTPIFPFPINQFDFKLLYLGIRGDFLKIVGWPKAEGLRKWDLINSGVVGFANLSPHRVTCYGLTSYGVFAIKLESIFQLSIYEQLHHKTQFTQTW